MESIRQLHQDEMAESRKLINFAFQHEEIDNKPLVQALPEQVWGYFMDKDLASNIVILPVETFVQGKGHKTGLIAGVASWPEYRNGGTVGKLMVHGIQAMYEKGCTLSTLGPFSYPFYRKYGWEMMYDYRRYKLRVDRVPDWQGSGQVRRIEPDISLLDPVYEQYASRYNGPLRRDERRWTSTIFARKKGLIALYTNGSGESTGYIIYQIKSRLLTVHEMVYLDRDSQKGLWEYIRKQNSMYDFVQFTAPSDDCFASLIDNPIGLETTVVTHLMARIVDVEGFLRSYRFRAGASAEFSLLVHDRFAPWNDGAFLLKIGSDGAAVIERSDAVNRKVSCDIQTLTTMLLGYRSPSFLHWAERLQGDPDTIKKLEEFIPKQTTYYLDFGH
ncbi:GNAT family N-acetyltransferase [Paenibacillus nasutitermitis]|uniref:GNAT family acetyltransferase n=1 Tax=Paenibacillus nasutitermitis TaxID=1652958 RepID=A0A916ZCI3_9BACL|nr:GNAT family N-acetyltransferase [Paenibacillus nasutitermitis]GGD85805.1 GNAT family acetyltransferase [Paenibacillus nasutitermitis]